MAALNVPDVLGYITGGNRATLNNVLQVATALRPRVVRAGRAFEMLLLMQNLTDLELEITATLRLPEKDSKGAKGRFVTKAGRLIVKLEAAGVSLITLPLSSMPDTAPAADYKIGMDLKIAILSKEKPQILRTTEDTSDFSPETLDEARQTQMADLKGLQWTANEKSALIGNTTTIESTLMVMSGTVGSFADLQPSQAILWSLKDHNDKRLLLQKLAPIITEQSFPQMTINAAFPILLEYTQKRFAKAKYPLQPMEMNLIARLLTLMVAYAAADERKPALYGTGRDYSVARIFSSAHLMEAADAIQLPRWFEAFMSLIEKDPRLAAHPVKAVAHFLYEELLRDAMLHAFKRVEQLVEVEIGTPEEREDYVTNIIAATRSGTMDFELLYMPLVLGGIIAADQVMLKGEKPGELIAPMRAMFEVRYKERNDDNAGTFELANTLIYHTPNKTTIIK